MDRKNYKKRKSHFSSWCSYLFVFLTFLLKPIQLFPVPHRLTVNIHVATSDNLRRIIMVPGGGTTQWVRSLHCWMVLVRSSCPIIVTMVILLDHWRLSWRPSVKCTHAFRFFVYSAQTKLFSQLPKKGDREKITRHWTCERSCARQPVLFLLG